MYFLEHGRCTFESCWSEYEQNTNRIDENHQGRVRTKKERLPVLLKLVIIIIHDSLGS